MTDEAITPQHICSVTNNHANSFSRRKQTFLEAIDFKEPASYRDAKLLSDAKYGKGGRMSKEQAECVCDTYECSCWQITRVFSSSVASRRTGIASTGCIILLTLPAAYP